MRKVSVYVQDEAFVMADELDMNMSELIRVALKELFLSMHEDGMVEALKDRYNFD